jgi:tRNA threonylcarbamoyladenosine biosynthesis protein TsaE
VQPLRARTEEEMRALGERLGRAATGGDVIGLVGPLGAGKTVLVQGLARGLGVPAGVAVTSPTFTIINEVRGGRLPLYHVDLYRLEDEAELEHVGLDDLYRRDDAVVAVEWFDRFPAAAPPVRIEIVIEPTSATERSISFTARGSTLLERIK